MDLVCADEARARRGRELVRDGTRWIRSHPEEWEEVQAICVGLHAEGLPVCRTMVYARCIERSVKATNRKDLLRAHPLYSCLIRYVDGLHPGLGIRYGKCCIDDAYPNGLPSLEETEKKGNRP